MRRLVLTLVCSLVLTSSAARGAAEATNAPAAKPSTLVSLDGEGWLVAIDPNRVGMVQKWWEQPQPGAKATKIPWTIQAVFPRYSGYAWFWRDVDVPVNPHKDGRYLLRFWDVDYLADVWVNGVHIGRHEGAQARFAFDATAAIKPGKTNRIAVRVLSLGGETIDGFNRGTTPHGGYTPIFVGGIFDSVELVVAPEVRTDDLFVRADPKTGKVRIEATVYSAAKATVRGSVWFSIAPANGGEAVATLKLDAELKPGVNTIRAEMHVVKPKVWELNDPFLYRMTARVSAAGSDSADETSTRFGFRDFRFENGYFRLNGRRVFWRSAHTGSDTAFTIRVPYDPGLLRRDLLNMKAAGFNGIRFISTMAPRLQLDMADELGLMVYEENYVSWMFQDSPRMAELADRTRTEMLLRDRNHPSIVMWGMLNETPDGAQFRHAVASLPLMRRLDDSRVIVLGSGRFEGVNNVNGLEVWKAETGAAPSLMHNPKSYAMCIITLWRPNEITVIPGIQGEYSATRWIAPADGDYTISAEFRGSADYTITSVHVLCDGKPIYESFINLKGRGDRCSPVLHARMLKGQSLDFVVGGSSPGGDPWYQVWTNTTALSAKITSAAGQAADLAGDFSNAKNPNGPWTYGWLAAGPRPDAVTFKAYPKCETENRQNLGGLSNPGCDKWEDLAMDMHFYPRVPHRELQIARLRGLSGNDQHTFLSEYGIGSGVDLLRLLRHHEQLGMDHGERVVDTIKPLAAAFMQDWERLKLDDTFAGPEDFFAKCLVREAAMKTMGLNAIRSNPNLVAYGMTGCNDPIEFGEGWFTQFREPKPGVSDAIFDGFCPVRWCTFAEPVSVYRGSKVRLEAVLSNHDSAPAGDYPARLQVVGPDGRRVLDRTITVKIPGVKDGKEPPFAFPVFDERVPIDGPTGKYRFLVTFQKGVAAAGGEAVFYVTDPADMPAVESEIVMWGSDPELAKWLKEHGIKVRPYLPGQSKAREVILVSYAANAGGDAVAWRDLAARITQGSTAVFLGHEVFANAAGPLGWLPLSNKGRLERVSEWNFPQVYPKDEWSKRHPLFDGLPSGGLMDYTFYREIIPDVRYAGQDAPSEAVAGAFRTSHPGAYGCDVMLSVYNFGAGRIILNSLRVRQELGQDPTAERLLRNMLRYAAKDSAKAPVELPKDFEAQLKAIGY